VTIHIKSAYRIKSLNSTLSSLDHFKEILEAGNLTEDELMLDPLSLRSIVLYHISDSQAYYREYLIPGEKITMYNGHEAVLIEEEGGRGLAVVDEMGREARIIEVEVKAGKGAVHIVDRCLVLASSQSLRGPSFSHQIQIGTRIP
jgi:hypothetical protein